MGFHALVDHTISNIEYGLSRYEPDLIVPSQRTRQAAVAIILYQGDDSTKVLFIKRACIPGDPWSGHMAFPGGHLEDDDEDLVEAAMRETEEEVGLKLRRSQFLGALSHQRAAPRGRQIDMIVAPYVFAIDTLPTFKLSHEVDEIVWGRFSDMFHGQNHDTETNVVAESKVPFNGYRLGESSFVWGLTYRTLQCLFAAVDPSYSHPAEAA